MNEQEHKSLPTADTATFDEMLGIRWHAIGDTMNASATVGRTELYGLLACGFVAISKKSPNKEFEPIASGQFNMKSADAKTVFAAMFRAACKCVHRKHEQASRHNKRVKEARKARRAKKKGA